MAYDKRAQFHKTHPEYNKDTEKIGVLQCVKTDDNGYCDWCETKHTKENLWFATLSYTWICDWCRQIRELEMQIDNIAKDRNDKNNIKTFYMDMYPYK